MIYTNDSNLRVSCQTFYDISEEFWVVHSAKKTFAIFETFFSICFEDKPFWIFNLYMEMWNSIVKSCLLSGPKYFGPVKLMGSN